MDGATVFQMVAGLGDAFGKSYSAARAQAQEDEAPGLIEGLLKTYQGGGAAPAVVAPVAGAGAPSAQPGRLPAFAGGDASMRLPGSGGEIETRFVNALKAGGLTNPAGLAAMAAYAGRESGYKPGNVTGSWSDPSESGQPGTSGGLLSWRGDRFANMRRLTAGAADPVTAQAQFALTENPTLTLALQNAKTPEEANSLMANAWKFAGYNRPGGEAAARLSATRSYLAHLGGVPAAPAPSAPAAAPATPAPAPQPAMPAFAQPGGPVRTMPAMGATAAAEPEADRPAPGAQPTQFVIPPGPAAAPAPAPVAPPAQAGFPGFGTRTARTSPEQMAALNALWKNPVTRPIATQMLGSVLKGEETAWTLTQAGDQTVLFNPRTAQIVPVGAAKRQTATVGNTVIDTATGQPIYSAPEKRQTATVGNSLIDVATGQPIYTADREEKFTYQSLPGVGMVALHPSNPDLSRVIIQGQQPRPLTEDERNAYRVPGSVGAGMGTDGKPFTLGSGSKTEVNVDTKGAGKFAEKANELQAKRYADMVEAADNAVPLRGDIETMSGLANQIATGRLAEAKLGLAQYAKAVGLDSIANSLTAGKMGEMEAFSALADKIVPRMRVPGSGATSDLEGRAFKNSLPSLLKSPEGNAIIVDTFRGLLDYQAQAGDLAGKALRGEVSQGEADQALKALPNPYARLKEYQGKAGSVAADRPLPKGADRVPPPAGYDAGRIVSEAKAAVAAGKDKTVIAERLRAYGIDPARLDR